MRITWLIVKSFAIESVYEEEDHDRRVGRSVINVIRRLKTNSSPLRDAPSHGPQETLQELRGVLRKNSMDDIDPSFECSCLCSLHPGVSLVWTAARSCLVIHPVFLCVTHSMTAGDLARRAGSVERTGARAVAESLNAVAALARVPVIDDHLHRHLASPNASGCTSPRRFVPPVAGDRVRGRPKAAVSTNR